jgi:glycosyltransferase involved in cell wall biosynthesis
LDEVEISVVMPCLNEEKTIGVCVAQAMRALDTMGVSGEVIVSDSSTDRSPEIAESLGARVVHQPAEGYGSAYLEGFAVARGRYIVMGDADNQLDFSEISRLVEPLHNGYDMVIGNRFAGKMLPGAMPWHHRYLGNPILTRTLNLFFPTSLGDALCGFRAFTRESLERMQLHSTGMEFALEMLAEASRADLRIAEVPVTLYPRADGSEAKLRSFRDGWRNLRFALLYSPDWLFLVPGFTMMAVGFLLQVSLLAGPLRFGPLRFDIHYVVLGSLLALLGFQTINLGLQAKVYALTQHFVERDKLAEWFLKWFSLERGILLGGGIFLIGLVINLIIVYVAITTGFGGRLRLREVILAMALMVIGAQTVFSSFYLSLLGIKRNNPSTKTVTPSVKAEGTAAADHTES